MLFAIRPSRRALLAELSLALSIPPHKFGSAVETHVLLDSTAGVGRISLQATNFDESFESTFNAQVDVLGRVALPTRKLHDYLRQLPDGHITISASEPHVIIVRSGRSMTRFTGLDPDAFPSAKPVCEPIFHFQAEILAAVLRRTRFAISSEDSRYVLKCLLLSLCPEHTRVVSTDGNRLTLIEMPSASTESLAILIPRTGIDPLMALAGAAGANEIAVAVDDTRICFSAGARQLSTHRVAGNFPNYEAVLPTGQGRELTVERQPLLDAVEHTVQFADSRKSAVKVQILENSLELSASSPEFGGASERIAVKFDGEPFAAAYNASFLCDFLRATESSPRISILFGDSQSAIELRPAERGGPFTYRYVVMPCSDH